MSTAQLLRWKIITGSDVATDLINFFAAFALVWGIQMRMKLKIEVILAFSCRLPMVALSILHLQSYPSFQQPDDPRLDISASLLYLQIMLIWSLLSATIPHMRAFIKSFDTALGMPAAPGNLESSSGYALATIGGTTPGSQTRKRDSRCSQAKFDKIESDDEGQGSQPSFRPDIGRTTTTVSLGDIGGSKRSEDMENCSENGSQELIINKKVQWVVRFDGPAQPS